MIPLATDFVQFATAKEGFRETRSPARSMYPDMKDLVARAVAAASARHAAALEKWKLVVKVDSLLSPHAVMEFTLSGVEGIPQSGRRISLLLCPLPPSLHFTLLALLALFTLRGVEGRGVEGRQRRACPDPAPAGQRGCADFVQVAQPLLAVRVFAEG